MASTSITLHARAVDKTGGVFASIAKSVRGIGLAISASAVAGVAAFAKTVSDLGKLSDVAQKAGATTSQITKLSTALGVLGVASSSPEQVANAFSRMQATTGQVGEDGFRNVLSQIGKLPTAMERAQAATAVFGRSGRDLIPVIEAVAKNGIGAFSSIADAMPGISQKAADAGDAVSDAFAVMTAKAKTLWSDAIGGIAGMMDGMFDGGIRAAAMRGSAYMEYFVKRVGRSVSHVFSNFTQSFDSWGEYLSSYFGALGRLVWEWIKSVGQMFANLGEQIWRWMEGEQFDVSKLLDDVRFTAALDDFTSEIEHAWDKADIVPDNIFADLDQQLADALGKADKAAANMAKAAIPANVEAIAEQAARALGRHSLNASVKENKFIRGDSYAAMTAGMRAATASDDAANEQRRGNSILEKIRAACDKTASAFGDIGVMEVY